MSNKVLRKIKYILAIVGPGIFLIGYNIGTGSVVTMAKSGAQYGMGLFWAVVLSCIFTYVLMVAYGKTTIITGKTALSNFKDNFQKYNIGHIRSISIIVALVFGELFSLIGITGIVSDLIEAGIAIVGLPSINVHYITFLLLAALTWLFWRGSYKTFEKVLVFFVGGMMVCFIVAFFLVDPNYQAIANGLVPSIPQAHNSLRVIAAIAGTTVSAAVFVVRSTVVAEKGWTLENLKDEKRDAFVSATMMLVLSGVMMAVAAGTLYVMGLHLDKTIDLIHLFRPIGGDWASLLLIFGIMCAGISTMFPIVLIAPWLISDYANLPRDMESPLYRTLGLSGFAIAFAMQFLGQNPPLLVVSAQAFQALILPAVVIPIIILMHNKKVMNGHKNTLIFDIGLGAALLFSVITAYFAVQGLLI